MTDDKKPRVLWLDPDYEGYFDDADENLIASGFTKVIAFDAYEKLQSDYERTIGIAHGALEAGHVEAVLRVLSSALERFKND